MPYFKDDREVYAALGRLFQDLIDDQATARQFRKADTIVQWQFRNPRAEIATVVPAEGEASVHLGPGGPKPGVIVAMDADTAHGFWLGRVSVVTALSAGQIKARGPVAKILTLVPLVKLAVPHYEALLVSLAAGGTAPSAPSDDEMPAPEAETEVAEAAEPEGEVTGDAGEPAAEEGAAEPDVAPEAEPEASAGAEVTEAETPASAVE